MRTVAENSSMPISRLLLMVSVLLLSGYRTNAQFEYDQAEFSGPRPWTSAGFKNDPHNFQSVIIGDRGGGASVKGTYQLAMDQINWLQPEFVMSVGDHIEGYTMNRDKLTEERRGPWAPHSCAKARVTLTTLCG